MQARLEALDRVQAVIEFDLAGNVLTANQNFLTTLGYSLGEIVGTHHSRFVPQGYEATPEYKAFWDRLRAGEFQAGQFMRIAKSGKEVWIEASYNPVLGKNGQPNKIIKFATDISRQKTEDAERAGLVEAVRKVQAVIEFTLEGMILNANQNFLSVLGFTLPEIQGKHHAMFVAPDYKASADYTAFWAKLKRGEFQTGQYKRIGKNGKEIWIQASYNPIFDAAGRPYKVVKFATDITDQVTMLAKLQRLIDQNFSQIDQALARSTTESGAADRVVESTSGSVQTMAAAAEELAASVDEISASMAKSKIATDSAFENVRAAGDFTKRLSDAASSMGGIVGLIQNIAGQINLLALNATIESARAGEAGRGFAVVAQEVKNLANQAAKATEQIGGEINGVQSISSDVVKALEAILKSVEIMRGNVVATSAAVEEQSVVTRDMSSNMQSAARDVAAISGNIAAISSAVTEVSNAVATTREAAKVLAR